MMRRRVGALAVAAALTLAACGDEPGTKGEDGDLLRASDVPDVADVSRSERPRVTSTVCPAMSSEWNLAVSDEFRSAEFRLAGGGVVRSTIQGPASGNDSIEPTFARLESMIDECTAAELRHGTFTRLDGLADDHLGFVSTQENADGRQVTERAYARIDDQRAVSVTVVRPGDETSPRAADLLPRALERARGGDSGGD